MKEITSAVILAAGLGTRLKSLTREKPKALMSVAGEPAICHVIRQLVSQGIHHIAINIHHHGQQLADFLGDGSRFNARFYFSVEKALLNSGGGLRTALSHLPRRQFIAVYNADIMSHIKLQQLSQLCPEQGCALALVSNPYHNLKGDFSLDTQQVLRSLNNPYTFSGVSVWSEQALLQYPTDTAFPLTTPIHDLMAKNLCSGFVYRGPWFDIGRPRDLIQANRLFKPEVL